MLNATVVHNESLESVAAGDPRACELFVLRLRPKLVALMRMRGVSPEDAEEIAQDALVAALWQLQSGRFAARSQVTTWLRAILDRRAIDHYRRQRRHTCRSRSLDSLTPSDRDQVLSRAVSTPESRAVLLVRDQLTRLPERHRRVLILNVLHGLSAREMAPMLRLGVKTTEALLTAARAAFRERFHQYPAR